MTSGDTNTRDKGVIDAYRAASDALDEQPAAQSRAAILAAAARAVEAQPQDAATGATARRFRPRERMSPIGPSRRPLALVASFLVATVALVIATQTDEQHDGQPSVDQAGAARVAEAPAAPAPKAGAEMEEKREAGDTAALLASKDQAAGSAPEKVPGVKPPEIQVQTAPMRKQPPAPAATAPATPKAEEAPARNERALADSSVVAKSAEGAQVGGLASTETAVSAVTTQAATAARPALAPQPAAAPPPPEQRAKENSSALARGPRADRRAFAETDAVAAGKLAKARPVERTAAIAEGTAEIENDPARWLERIAALREAGRDDEADRELARLRERYPDTKVPPNALRRTGTR